MRRSSSTTSSLRLEPLEDRTLLSVDLVRDIQPGPQSSWPYSLVAVGDTAFFGVHDGTQSLLWKSDGTEAGTEPVSGNVGPDNQLIAVGKTLFFAVNGSALWLSDGTPDGTRMVLDLFDKTQCPRMPELIAFGQSALFTFWDIQDYGRCGKVRSSDLWISDGTEKGTVQLLHQGPEQAIVNLKAVGDRAFFTVRSELWVTDGTEAGTQPIYRFAPGGQAYDQVAVGGTLFFTANDGTHGRELWRSDGTPEGTTLVTDLRPGPLGAFDANQAYPFMAELNGEVFFTANDGETGFELYKSDGTPEGTVLVADLREGPASSAPRNLTAAGGILYFTAADDFFGRELWATFGTPETTYLVRDINAKGDAFPATQFTNLSPADVGGFLYFVANDGKSGWELWVSDGTEDGTYLVRDINPGGAGAFDPRGAGASLTDVNGRLFFAANDGKHGVELWASVGGGAGPAGGADVVMALLALESTRSKKGYV